jgi:hypothetical protein
MYHSPSSPVPIPSKFSISKDKKDKGDVCKDIDKLRSQFEACLINESSIIICASSFIAYKQCLRKN